MIEKLHLKNYRSFRDVEIKLKPFSVFIGPNGAGKSNLISVFEFIGRAIKEDVSVALSVLGDFKSVKHIKAEENEKIEISIGYRARGEPPEEEKKIGRIRPRMFTYHLEIAQTSENEPKIVSEWLRAKRPFLKREGAPWYYLKVDEKSSRVANPKGEYEDRDNEVELKRSSPYELALSGSRALKQYPYVQNFYKFLANWYVSRFEPSRARESMKYSKIVKLSSTGDDLVLFIENLERYNKPVLNELVETIKDKIPGFEDVKIQHTPDGKLYLSIIETDNPNGFFTNAVSDGTIRLLGIMSILRDPNPPDLICIEEPENNLHPHLMELLVDELRSASVKSQVIVTTHSPYFIDNCDPQEVFVIEKRNGETKIEPISKLKNQFIQSLLTEDLGQLWYQNAFGGNP